MKNIIESLNWRYATKKFDASKKLDEDTFNTLMEAIRLSPSSLGLQPWKFIIVKNKDLRQKIHDVAANQSQILDASHLVVFAVKTNINDQLADEYVNLVSRERNIDVKDLQGLSDMIKSNFVGKSKDELINWASHQTYIPVGVLVTSCAILGVDACPMEGFDSKKLDELLELQKQNLSSRVIVGLGYRGDDKYANYKKVRFSKNEVFISLD